MLNGRLLGSRCVIASCTTLDTVVSNHPPWQAQLRLTAQRLGQMQDRMESQAQITQRDIATLLQQGNIALARAKAQKQMREDVKGNLMQMLEMHLGVILGHLNELERRCAAASGVCGLHGAHGRAVTCPAPL